MVHRPTRQEKDVRVRIPQQGQSQRQHDVVRVEVDGVRTGVLEELLGEGLDVGQDGALLIEVGGVGSTLGVAERVVAARAVEGEINLKHKTGFTRSGRYFTALSISWSVKICKTGL